jgi:hypothetical protein
MVARTIKDLKRLIETEVHDVLLDTGDPNGCIDQ